MYRKQLKAAGDFHLNKAKQDTLHVKLNVKIHIVHLMYRSNI